jgi:hypothetical protein
VRALVCGTAWKSERAERGQGPDRWGTARAAWERPSRGARGWRGLATSRDRPNRGGEDGLTGGP